MIGFTGANRNLLLASLFGIASAVPVEIASIVTKHSVNVMVECSEVELVGGSMNWPPERRRGRRKGWMRR